MWSGSRPVIVALQQCREEVAGSRPGGTRPGILRLADVGGGEREDAGIHTQPRHRPIDHVGIGIVGQRQRRRGAEESPLGRDRTRLRRRGREAVEHRSPGDGQVKDTGDALDAPCRRRIGVFQEDLRAARGGRGMQPRDV